MSTIKIDGVAYRVLENIGHMDSIGGPAVVLSTPAGERLAVGSHKAGFRWYATPKSEKPVSERLSPGTGRSRKGVKGPPVTRRPSKGSPGGRSPRTRKGK